MEECIFINPEIFLERYPFAIQFQNSILSTEKIKNILALDCFHDKANFVPKRRVNQSNAPQQVHIRQKEKTLSYHDKLIREVIGNINKINTSNFDTICNKISRIIDANNIGEITRIILETASGPHHIYMDQLLNMLNNFPQNLNEAKMSTIKNFSEESIENIDNLLSMLNDLDLDENYDNFCKLIKQKAYLSYRWIMLYHLFHTNQIDLQPETMFEKLQTNLIKYCDNKAIQTHMMEMLFDFFKNFKKDHPHCYLLFLETLTNFEKELTTKASFIYKDIIGIKC